MVSLIVSLMFTLASVSAICVTVTPVTGMFYVPIIFPFEFLHDLDLCDQGPAVRAFFIGMYFKYTMINADYS